MIDAAVAIFSGFTERSASRGNGCADLFDLAADRFSGPYVRVSLHTWRADTRDLAWHIWDRRNRNQPLKVSIAGYSYGANAALRFARHLIRCGVRQIDTLALVDPVVRWNCLPGVAAAFGWGGFVVPCEVRNAIVAAQANPRWSLQRRLQGGPLFDPAGHTVWTCVPTRRIEVATPPHTSHRRIDEQGRVAGTFLDFVERLLEHTPDDDDLS